MYAYACTDEDEPGESDYKKVADVMVANRADATSLYTDGAKHLPTLFAVKDVSVPSDVRYTDYKFDEVMHEQKNRIVGSEGGTQVRATIDGKLEAEVKFKRALNNSQTKDFEDDVAKQLIGERDHALVPPPLNDSKGEPRIGLPLVPYGVKNPRRSTMTLMQAANDLNVKLTGLSAKQISDLYTKLIVKNEDMDRIARIALNELLINVRLIIEDAWRNEETPPTAKANVEKVELAVSVVIECITQAKINVNKEMLLACGAKLDLKTEETQSNPFHNALVIGTDAANREKNKKLKKHIATIMTVSKRPATKPNAGQHQAGRPNPNPRTPIKDRLGTKVPPVPTGPGKPNKNAKDKAAAKDAGRGGKNGRGGGGRGRGGGGRGNGRKAYEANTEDNDAGSAEPGDE